jgi:LmbE family N-acetylglucosaminyl deacetylase
MIESKTENLTIHAGTSEEKKKMVAVLAHPDDETFGMGGSLAHYAARGVEITLICTTHGEAGDVQPQYLEGHESIAALRTAELQCAAKKLGIHEVIQLDYRDSGMQGTETNDHPRALINSSIDQVACEIAAHLRRVRPQVVVTHDPVGNYFHPDHIATHEATVLAFFLTGDDDFHCEEEYEPFQPDYLYFYTFLRRRMKWLLWVMPLLGMNPKRYGRNHDIDLERILTIKLPVHVEVNFKEVEQIREQASRCHASQGGGSRSMTLYGRIRRWLSATKDAYMQAYPEVSNGRVRQDLFE